MAQFKQVTIIGVGLIGGSLAKAIKKRKVSPRIVGYFRNTTKAKKALRQRLVSGTSDSIADAVRGSDLIILASPVSHILHCLPIIKKAADPKAVIIDVGSTKSLIVSKADKLKLNFVGTHPLAGSEKKGSDFSNAVLFNDSFVIITPSKRTNKNSLSSIKRFWRALKANVLIMPTHQHDQAVAFISHVPHFIAYSLMHGLPKSLLPLCASGLKDTTRIALSDPRIWNDIFVSNKNAVLTALKVFEKHAKAFSNALAHNRTTQLMRLLESSQKKRQSICS